MNHCEWQQALCFRELKRSDPETSNGDMEQFETESSNFACLPFRARRIAPAFPFEPEEQRLFLALTFHRNVVGYRRMGPLVYCVRIVVMKCRLPRQRRTLRGPLRRLGNKTRGEKFIMADLIASSMDVGRETPAVIGRVARWEATPSGTGERRVARQEITTIISRLMRVTHPTLLREGSDRHILSLPDTLVGLPPKCRAIPFSTSLSTSSFRLASKPLIVAPHQACRGMEGGRKPSRQRRRPQRPRGMTGTLETSTM